jgi:hypothetical protein
LHCGSTYGLTPPDHFQDHHLTLQKETWDAYVAMTRKWAHPDILIVNGDTIEGTQSKQGGAELITADRNIQCEIAVEALQKWNAGQIFMTYGSRYHVGEQAEDFEYNIAKTLNATIEGRLYLNIEGMIFDIRHKLGQSVIPHGRATILLREMLWDLIKAGHDAGPKVNVVVRSHVHYHIWVEQPNQVMFTTPCLQLARGRYGSRECIGETHWGAIRLTIHKGQIIGKDINIWKLAANNPKVIRIK